MVQKIAFFNHKGGVSKTTTTFNLGWMLAENERRQGKPFKTDVTEIIHQMREERDRQLMEVRSPIL
ncbi:MAG: ParA family protein [Microcystis aeruginosa K13-10]|nr:ParA family protein [Microcystis aeruginosa K13-10]